MNNLMFDLETLGRKPGCGITEIGWCCFSSTEYKVSAAFGHVIPLEQNMLYGFKREIDTIRWWLEKQGGFPNLTPAMAHMTLPQILSDVAAQWNELWFAGVQWLWSKPSLFDIPILKEVFDLCAVERPIILREENFHCWRDMMTITDIETLDGAFAKSLMPTAHRAKADAEAQARRVSSILSLQHTAMQDAANYRVTRAELIDKSEQNKRQATKLQAYESAEQRRRSRGRIRRKPKSRKR